MLKGTQEKCSQADGWQSAYHAHGDGQHVNQALNLL